jgi:hypothetical protein
MFVFRTRHLIAALVASALVAGMGAIIAAPASAACPPFKPTCNPDPGDPPTPRVSPPTNAGVSSVTSTSANLTWTDNTRDETGFVITRYQHTTPNSTWQVNTFVLPASAGTTTYALPQNDLLPQETVQWDVQATRAGATTSMAAITGTLTVDLSRATTAAAQLLAFQSDWQSAAFSNVNKAAVLADAARIVANPTSSINQGIDTGACGPAAVEFRLVAQDPARFVDTIRSIADSGAFTTPDGTVYTAHPELRASAPNPTTTPANWLFMATLKDSYNAVRITGSTHGNDIAWVSSPADVDNWLSHVDSLHTTTATAILRPFTSGESVMPGATSVLPGGGAVVLLVDSSLVGNPPGAFSEPNHYVNLLSWSATSSTVTFKVATWGTTSTITTSWSNFDGLTWDVLTAR